MIVLEDEERCGQGMPGAHHHELQMMPADDLTNVPPGWAACAGDCTVACAGRRCAEEECSYDLFDLQDSGLVPSY